MSNYDDIINLDRPKSKYEKLNINSRAAQFAPFAALTGYDSAIKETSRLTEKKRELDDGLRDNINSKLKYICDNIKEKNKFNITYFEKDNKKAGGKYISISGIVKKVDSINEIIKMEDNTIIDMKDILDITGSIFDK